MGRVVLACKSDEERNMATCPVFAPYPIHTDRQAESARNCVGFRLLMGDTSESIDTYRLCPYRYAYFNQYLYISNKFIDILKI